MKNFAILALVVAAGSANAAIITQWDFNFGNDANTGTGTTSPAIGAGTASLLGVTATFASGDATGGSSDPNVGDDSAWNTTSYAPQGTEDKARGVQFMVDTTGFNTITVGYDLRHSNTSSRFVQFQYTTDGTTFTDFGAPAEADLGGDTWYNLRSVDLTGVSGVNNNANFGFRVVATFAPGTTDYTAATSTSNYGTGGTMRYDMVTVNGEAVPEPATMIALGAGLLALARRRRSN